MKDTAGLRYIVYRDNPRKAEPVHRYVRNHTLGAHILRLTDHRYREYELPKVPARNQR